MDEKDDGKKAMQESQDLPGTGITVQTITARQLIMAQWATNVLTGIGLGVGFMLGSKAIEWLL